MAPDCVGEEHSPGPTCVGTNEETSHALPFETHLVGRVRVYWGAQSGHSPALFSSSVQPIMLQAVHAL